MSDGSRRTATRHAIGFFMVITVLTTLFAVPIVGWRVALLTVPMFIVAMAAISIDAWLPAFIGLLQRSRDGDPDADQPSRLLKIAIHDRSRM